MFDQLRAHQDRARAIMARARTILDAPDPDISALAQARWELARVLRAYQIFKHCSIFDPLIAGGRADLAATAQDLKRRCIQAGEAFQAHLLRWSGVSVRDVWAEYRPAALAIATMLEAHLDREAAAVTRLEAQIAMPSHPAVAGPLPPRPERAPTMRF